jgi:hypothetical protein
LEWFYVKIFSSFEIMEGVLGIVEDILENCYFPMLELVLAGYLLT